MGYVRELFMLTMENCFRNVDNIMKNVDDIISSPISYTIKAEKKLQ